jgi:hypothetical protein
MCKYSNYIYNHFGFQLFMHKQQPYNYSYLNTGKIVNNHDLSINKYNPIQITFT